DDAHTFYPGRPAEEEPPQDDSQRAAEPTEDRIHAEVAGKQPRGDEPEQREERSQYHAWRESRRSRGGRVIGWSNSHVRSTPIAELAPRRRARRGRPAGATR